jgi:hypothetical protein
LAYDSDRAVSSSVIVPYVHRLVFMPLYVSV